ncbi:HTH-type transcriptional repressor KstR2 [Novipirellula galeiformis]|uniref:HTH-type transcriptional repressor KstR2 n=1 Tax=Novipirellula galeiformis TaxID=2528004 RepID=A0A5C6CG25_9BACT|nr:TetR/AcrR family transcriptional regulator [Novipirellula galeiformis]TWU23015.1 HTH-type transcriptional repressor KstR2 [Novipirellula galeiformis]
MAPTTGPETTTRILDAVMQLILAGGLPAVTLSAVCRKAGLSKGGLMHHFPSKESLVDAFLEQAVGDYLNQVQQAAAPHAVGTGQRAKAILELFLGEPTAAEPDCDCAAVMVALVQGGGGNSLVNEVHQTLLQLMREDGLSRDLSELILATIDGVWLQSIIAANDIIESRKKRIHKKLKQLIESEMSMKFKPIASEQ